LAARRGASISKKANTRLFRVPQSRDSSRVRSFTASAPIALSQEFLWRRDQHLHKKTRGQKKTEGKARGLQSFVIPKDVEKLGISSPPTCFSLPAHEVMDHPSRMGKHLQEIYSATTSRVEKTFDT
jgi:hypothetical protein